MKKLILMVVALVLMVSGIAFADPTHSATVDVSAEVSQYVNIVQPEDGTDMVFNITDPTGTDRIESTAVAIEYYSNYECQATLSFAAASSMPAAWHLYDAASGGTEIVDGDLETYDLIDTGTAGYLLDDLHLYLGGYSLDDDTGSIAIGTITATILP